MNHNAKRILLMLSIALIVIAVPVSVFAAVSDFDLFGGGDQPPKMTADESENENPGEQGDDKTQKSTLTDAEIDYLLVFLKNLKEESLSGSESADETARISRKTALLQEYRSYMDSIRKVEMTEDEYKKHVDHLMDIYSDLKTVEPEKTPEERIAYRVSALMGHLTEKYYYCTHKENYAKDHHIDVVVLEEAISVATAITDSVSAGDKTYEELKNEYVLLLQKAKVAMPGTYATMVSTGVIVEDIDDYVTP